MLRVTTYAACAFLVAALLAARALKADITEAALAVGHQLGALGDLVEGSDTVLLNGERLHHASTYTDQDLETVLGRLEDYCAESPNFVGRALRDIPKDLAKKIEQRPLSRASRLGLVREQKDDRGMVACFVDDRPSGLPDFGERLRRFMSTRKLSEFGQFRYAYVERTRSGRAHVVITWADTGLDIKAMFPAEGDAAGADSAVLPRPAEAQRTLTAAAEGHPFAVRLYVSSQPMGTLKAFYDEWMPQHGFTPVAAQNKEGTTAFLRGDGYQAFVSLMESKGRTSVTLTEAGYSDRPNIAAVEVKVE